MHLHYYFHYLVVVAAGTVVNSVRGLFTYNGILPVTRVVIADATVVIAAVVAVVVVEINFIKSFLYFHF